MKIENSIFDDGTWIEGEEFCYPKGGWTRFAYAKCQDGVRRKITCTVPDTLFSIPAKYRSKGKTVKGILKISDARDGIEFIAFKTKERFWPVVRYRGHTGGSICTVVHMQITPEETNAAFTIRLGFGLDEVVLCLFTDSEHGPSEPEPVSSINDRGPILRFNTEYVSVEHTAGGGSFNLYDTFKIQISMLPEDLKLACIALVRDKDDSAIAAIMDIIQEHRGTPAIPEVFVTCLLKLLQWE